MFSSVQTQHTINIAIIVTVLLREKKRGKDHHHQQQLRRKLRVNKKRKKKGSLSFLVDCHHHHLRTKEKEWGWKRSRMSWMNELNEWTCLAATFRARERKKAKKKLHWRAPLSSSYSSLLPLIQHTHFCLRVHRAIISIVTILPALLFFRRKEKKEVDQFGGEQSWAETGQRQLAANDKLLDKCSG